MWNTVLLVSAVAAGLMAAAWILAAARWSAGTRTLRARLEAARAPGRSTPFDPRELEGLPSPVQRFFRTTIAAGQPMVGAVRMRQRGTFNTSEAGEAWKPFTSDQVVFTQRPGFDWNARIAMAPGLVVRVHDAYVAGDGLLRASLFGLVPVAAGGGEEMAEGELMRYLAEAAWYPTALLPGRNVRWNAVDDRSARATLTDGGREVTLRFTFDEAGRIDTVFADERGRTVKGRSVPTAWEGRFWNYAERGGMQVPLDGEVAWLLPAGRKPYWRGRVVEVDYDFVS